MMSGIKQRLVKKEIKKPENGLLSEVVINGARESTNGFEIELRIGFELMALYRPSEKLT